MRIIVFAGLLAFAQTAKAEDCSSVIALSKVSSSTISSKNSFEQAASRFCNDYSRSKSSGTAMNAGGSYGAVSASFGQSSSDSEQVASRVCSADDNSKKADNAYEEYVNTIAPGAYGAYQQCLALSDSDVRFSVDEAAILPKQLVMTVNYTSHQGQAQTAQLSYFASEGVACRWSSGEAASIQVQSPQTVSLACSRSAFNSKAFITVTRTDGGSKISLPWPEYTAEGIPVNTITSLNNQIAALATQIGNLVTSGASERIRVDQLTALSEGEKGSLAYTIVPNSTNCPTGWSRLGTIGVIVQNSDYPTANLGQGGAFNDGWTWTHPNLCKRK